MTAVDANARLEAALAYAALGWPVVPLHTPKDGVCDCPDVPSPDPKKDRKGGVRCPSPGKHPRTIHGLEDATTDVAKITRWWSIWPHANIAIDLARSGLVDVAPDSVEWYAEFLARGLPDTTHFASGGGDGHAHYLYLRTDDCPTYRLTETGKYDILSAGYAVMPPSLHVSGVRYAPLDAPICMPTTSAPSWAVGMLVERGSKKAHADASSGVSFDGDAPPIALHGDALERWSGRQYTPGPKGIDRSQSLWRIAVDLLEAGLAPTFVEVVIAARDIALGWEKFAGRGDAHTRYHVITERAVAGQGSKRVRLNEPKPSKPSSSPLQYLSIREFNQRVEEDIAWSVVGWVGDGLITEIDGKAKRSGKTTLLLAMASAILHGKSFLGQETHRTPILYLTEQSGPSFKRSLRRSGLEDDDDFTLLLWGDTKGWTWEQLIPDVLAKCDELGVHVLIIDTLAQFSGVRGDDENRSGAALEVMEPLQAATTRPLGILISRHDRKAGGAAGDSARGSSAFAGAVDIILHLDRPEPKPGTERQRVIEGIGRFEETPDNVLIVLNDGEPQTYRLMGDVDDLHAQDMREEILAALPTEQEEAMDRDEVEKHVTGSSLEIGRFLKQLVADGEVGVEKKKTEDRQRARQFFWQLPKVERDPDDGL